MTTRRLILSLGASAGALALAAMMAVRSFPLEAQGQPAVTGSGPVQIVKGGEHLLHGEVPEYPHRAVEGHVEGDVVLDLAVDERGEVSDARVLSGPDELRKSALEAVLGWHYSPSAVRSMSTQATLRFYVPPPDAELNKAEFGGRVFVTGKELEQGIAFKSDKLEIILGEPASEQQAEHLIDELRNAIADPQISVAQREEFKAKLQVTMDLMAKRKALRDNEAGRGSLERSTGPLRLARVKTERVSDEAVKGVMARAGLKIGDAVTEEALKRLRAAATDVDEHLNAEFQTDDKGNLTVMIISR